MKGVTVKRVDKPTYEIDDEILQQFNEQKNIFGRVIYDNTAPFFYKWDYVNSEKMIENKKKGYSRVELARVIASWTLYNHFVGAFSDQKLDNEDTKLTEPQLSQYEIGDMVEFTKEVKDTALKFGASLVGICKLNRKWLYMINRHGKPIHIPKDYTHAIVMAIEMNDDIFNSPDWSAVTSGGISYSQMAFLSASVAQFIRHLGYKAISSGNDTALNIPLAIDAGLGELGRSGMLITPELGSKVRICKVFTDIPLIVDKQVDFSLQDYCRKCKLCIEACEVSAISCDIEPSYEIKSVSNNPGIKRWVVDVEKCYMFWLENGGGCSNCIAACPFSK